MSDQPYDETAAWAEADEREVRSDATINRGTAAGRAQTRQMLAAAADGDPASEELLARVLGSSAEPRT